MAPSRIIVEDLPYGATEQDLRAVFGQVGEVVSVEMHADPATGGPSGTALVTMATQADAADAIRRLRRYVLYGRRLRVRPAGDWQLADMAAPLTAPSRTRPPARPGVRPHRPERKPGS